MKLHRFLARDATDAIQQIRAELGSEAVVAHVSPVPTRGIQGLWRKPQIEVLAYVPEAEPTATQSAAPQSIPLPEVHFPQPSFSPEMEFASDTAPRGVNLLRRMGLLPLLAEQVWERALSNSGDRQPREIAEEVQLLRQTLSEYWKPLPPTPNSTAANLEVFIGPPGSGKTTALCKWLAQLVLAEGVPAVAFRLDGPGTNHSSQLTLLCEMLGVAVHRVLKPGTTLDSHSHHFVDLPGINFREPKALEEVQSRIAKLPECRVHLCLNAAYSTPMLMEQVRAFTRLPVADLIFTHLDEERCWGKLWNFAVGTSYPIRYLGAGQNIPGYLRLASPETLLQP